MRRGFYEFYTSTKSPLARQHLGEPGRGRRARRCGIDAPLGLKVLTRIRALYAIEAEIRGKSAEHRKQVRQARSRPIVDAPLNWLKDHVGRVSTVSDLSDAIRYGIRHWPGLVVFLDERAGRDGHQCGRASD